MTVVLKVSGVGPDGGHTGDFEGAIKDNKNGSYTVEVGCRYHS